MLGSLLQCWGQQGHVRPETLRARSHTRVTLRVAGAAGRRARLITRSIAEAPAPPQSRTDAEARVFKQLEQAVQAGRAPSRLLFLFGALYSNYQEAVLGSNVDGADERAVADVMAAIADRVVHDMGTPFTFPSTHHRILEPYDYYAFGQNYVRWLINFKQSVVGNLHHFDNIESALSRGENVVMIANHQTEADPAVWALLLEHTHPRIATDVFYVAGDRVVSDPLCKPFSMGRNLFCVHSKKRMDDDPSQREAKQRTNRRTLSEMVKELNAGGKLIWIAPSGGRDRPNADGQWIPDTFDPAAVELMRQMLAKAKPPGHLYPLAMHSGEIMPPPPSKEKDVGEHRITRHAAVGLSAGAPLNVEAITGSLESTKDKQVKLGDAAYQAVKDEYLRIEEAIQDPYKGTAAGFAQPWLS